MADLVNPSPTIEHGAYESSTYVEAMDPKGEEKSPEENPVMNPKTSPERSSRMCGGDCDCHLPPPLYQQNLTSYAGQTYQNPQWQDTQWQWQDPMSMAQWPSNTQPQDYGCCQQQRATGSTNYMEYKGFQHSPKPNPVYVPMECSVYTQESRQGIQSICSCGTIPPCETNYPPKRKRSQGSFAGLKGSFERCRRRKKHYSYEAIISPRRPSTERCCELPRKLNPSDRAYYLRSATPCARTCSNRQHTQVNGPCQSPLPPPPPMRCSPPLRRRSRSRSRCSTRRIRPSPSDCMEKNRPGAEYLKSLDVRANCTYNAQSCDNPAYGRTRSQSPHYQRDSSKRCCCKPSPMTTEPVVCYPPRSRSPCCPRPQPATTKRNCRCSNETLIEEPVKSYRFRCPENRIITLCPHCHKALIKRHRSALTTKRCTSGATRKSCSRFIPVSKMSQVPSNRCIYRTLSRNLTRPKTSSTYRPKYQMNLCCLKRRCQGGANEYRNHHQPASSLKKTQKYPGGQSGLPSRTSSHRSNNSTLIRYSSPRPALSMPASANGYQSRASHHQSRTADPSSFQKQNQSEHMPSGRDPRLASSSRRDPRLASNSGRDPRSALKPERDPRLALNSGRDHRSAQNSERDPRLASNSGRDPRSTTNSRRDSALASMSERDPRLAPNPDRNPRLTANPERDPRLAPNTERDLRSAPNPERDLRSAPNPERDHRSAPNPDRDRRSAPNPDRDHRSAPNSDRDPRSAPNPEKDPRLASNSGKDPPKSSMSGRDQLIASMSGSDPPKASRGPQLASQLAPFVAPQLTPQLASSPALQREHRTSSPRAEGPSNSRHRHRSHREHSHRKEKNKEQQQPQEPFYPQARPELAPVYMGSPPPANAMPQEVFGHQTYRPANFMGTEINPFYRGTFLDPRSVATSHPYHMGPVQLRKYDALPKLPRTARHPSMMLMPPKWTGLGQLQTWIFGESCVGQSAVPQSKTWSWRQIFGRPKKPVI
ncbi:serine/arginine repetitive matrix protein 1 isoform X2 [Drosophila kikkawai]|uniref:Serine/arginine repetitive matrix protein 1 isoform X2 n=1 Tax=Drosophila kikkawai TaxID=30033 RepID=A0ABM3C7Q9_DROKI|nr:serine/arginine repetitive matrix protein 1 isoform X2 [Drosophila kikkawai]